MLIWQSAAETFELNFYRTVKFVYSEILVALFNITGFGGKPSRLGG